RTAVLEAAERMQRELKDAGLRVKLDAREGYRPGWKFNEYEVQGVPVRLALGPRDVQNGVVEVARRDTGEKQSLPQAGLAEALRRLLDEVQQGLFDRALAFREANTTPVDSYDEFKEVLESKGGFLAMHWDGTAETEARVKEETKATIRCIPFDQVREDGVDPVSGRPSEGRVLYAKAY
ncbi:MAG TPA: His/Gly/Thr/Pro-type tRNA ligase C-terminal domain-containing protein, partial [Rhodothermales bacterium]|nr:His/Gly/Thr/Pro-type tRNA ligase C-terminal domain-containing protein [Rhodothermales bacterium]